MFKYMFFLDLALIWDCSANRNILRRLHSSHLPFLSHCACHVPEMLSMVAWVVLLKKYMFFLLKTNGHVIDCCVAFN
jgi:hypothetical protein